MHDEVGHQPHPTGPIRRAAVAAAGRSVREVTADQPLSYVQNHLLQDTPAARAAGTLE